MLVGESLISRQGVSCNVLCSLSQMTWLAGMEGIAADYRHMEGYGVNTFTLINSEGKDTYVKFHWRPRAGVGCFHPLLKRLFPKAEPARAISQGHVCHAHCGFHGSFLQRCPSTARLNCEAYLHGCRYEAFRPVCRKPCSIWWC